MKLKLVPARTGATWVKLGMQTFFKQPLALAGLFFIFMAVMSVASTLPIIGLPLAMTLLPAATLGLMAATREATQGKFPMPLILFTALRAGPAKLRAMLMLGALYAAGFMLAMGGSYLVDGGGFARLYLGGSAPTAELLQSPDFQSAMWLFISLHLPLSLMFWHAPALVFWHDVGIHPGDVVLMGAGLVFASTVSYALYLVGAGHAITRIGALRFTAYAMMVASAACVLQFVLMRPLSALALPVSVYQYSIAMALFSTVLPVFLLLQH